MASKLRKQGRRPYSGVPNIAGLFSKLPISLDPISLDTTVHEAVESKARKRLEKIVRRIEVSGGMVEESHHKGGEPDAEIVALGEEISAGLIVMGSRGLGGMKRALTGTVSDSVVTPSRAESLRSDDRGARATTPTDSA